MLRNLERYPLNNGRQWLWVLAFREDDERYSRGWRALVTRDYGVPMPSFFSASSIR